MTFIPSHFQEAIFSFVSDDRAQRAGIVNAVAGSGKTTTLEHASNLLRCRALFCAFNKHIADRLDDRLANNMRATTVHSIGMGTLYRRLKKKPQVDDGKYWELVRDYVGTADELKGVHFAIPRLMDFVRFARLTLTDYTDTEALEIMAARYGLEWDPRLATAANTIIDRGIVQAVDTGAIDFTDMLSLPAYLNLQPSQYPFVFIDECQDLSRSQLELVMKCIAPGGRSLWVGDPCQPAGTLVKRKLSTGNRWHEAAHEDVAIENLKVGDEVLTANLGDASFYSNGKVTGITKRPFSGDLIVATTETGWQSKYTPNHYCVASFKPFDGKWFVYVMQSGNRFRVGMSATLSNKRGAASRFRNEKADAIWILGFYDSRTVALQWEAAIAGRFGLPQLMFNETKFKNNSTIAEAWQFIGDNSARAYECLQYFGRDVRYPLFRKEAKQVSLRRPISVHASNLTTGCLMLPFKNQHHFKLQDWQSIRVTREPYTGPVYSLSVSPHELYVADGILTHNCQAIMGFAGADSHSYQAIRERTGARELPLSICYRCPTSVLAHARQIVPHIQPRPNAPVGVVRRVTEQTLLSAREGDLIMARRNAPLVKHCLRLIRRGVQARVRGRDIGKELADTVIDIGRSCYNYFSLPDFVEKYREQHRKTLDALHAAEDQFEMLNDKCDAILECFEGFTECRSAQDLGRKIESIFTDIKAAVWLSSIHRAKGLEANTTWLLGFDALGKPRENSTPEQAVQEMNLKYVGITRSLHTMNIL